MPIGSSSWRGMEPDLSIALNSKRLCLTRNAFDIVCSCFTENQIHAPVIPDPLFEICDFCKVAADICCLWAVRLYFDNRVVPRHVSWNMYKKVRDSAICTQLAQDWMSIFVDFAIQSERASARPS